MTAITNPSVDPAPIDPTTTNPTPDINDTNKPGKKEGGHVFKNIGDKVKEGAKGIKNAVQGKTGGMFKQVALAILVVSIAIVVFALAIATRQAGTVHMLRNLMVYAFPAALLTSKVIGKTVGKGMRIRANKLPPGANRKEQLENLDKIHAEKRRKKDIEAAEKRHDAIEVLRNQKRRKSSS